MHGQSPTHAHGVRAPWMLLGGLVAGVLACATLLLLHGSDTKYVFVALAGTVILVLLPLVGNLRLFCLYGILMLAPFALRLSFFHYPHMGGAGALLIDVIDPFMLLLLFFQVRDRVRGYRRTYRFPLAGALWAGMILLGIGSVIFGYLRTVAFNEVFRMMKLLLLLLLIVNEMVRRPQFHHAIVALTVGVILQAALALTQYLTGAQLGLQFLGEASDEDIKTLSAATLSTGDFVYRPGGLLGHSNLLAGYLALYLPVGVALLLSPVSRRLKALSTLALLVGQPALVLTLSRTGWIDFIIALAIVLALGASHPVSRRRFLLGRAAIIAGTVAVAVALSPLILQRLFESDANAVEVRIEWLQTARAMILDHPVFGVGLNSYVYAQVPYGKNKTPVEMTDRYGQFWPTVHNSWVLTWAEQGTVGFILWVAFHFSVIAVAIRNLRIRDPLMHALGVGLLAGFIGVMIDGLGSFFVRQEATARMFWIAAALILAVGYWRRVNEEEEPALAELMVPPNRLQSREGATPVGRWLPARKSLLR